MVYNKCGGDAMNFRPSRADSSRRLAWISALLVLLSPSLVRAQDSKVDSVASQTASRIAALAAIDIRKGAVGRTEAILRQRDGALRTETLSNVADSIVAIATARNFGNVGQSQMQLNAIMLLLNAGKTSGGGIPYDSAAEKLLVIARTADDVGKRASALFSMSHLPDTAKIGRLLRSVAVSSDWTTAHVAVQHLAYYLGQPGLRILRELHSSGTVKERYAREELDFLARKHGWP